MKNAFVSLFLVSVLTGSVFAVDNLFQPSSGRGNWNDPCNWSLGRVPEDGVNDDTARIKYGCVCDVNSVVPHVDRLVFGDQDNATLNIYEGAGLYVAGSITFGYVSGICNVNMYGGNFGDRMLIGGSSGWTGWGWHGIFNWYQEGGEAAFFVNHGYGPVDCVLVGGLLRLAYLPTNNDTEEYWNFYVSDSGVITMDAIGGLQTFTIAPCGTMKIRDTSWTEFESRVVYLGNPVITTEGVYKVVKVYAYCDFNQDCDVDFGDFALFANKWLDQTCAPDDWCDGADLDKSGAVDSFDLLTFIEDWRGEKEYEIEQSSYTAYNPRPLVCALPKEILTWSAGKGALSHDVYLGMDSNDVNNATTSDVTIYKGNFDSNSYDPCGLSSGATYYWRVDEVNDTNTFKGDIWSFTVATDAIFDHIDLNEPNMSAVKSYLTGGQLTEALEEFRDEFFAYNNGIDLGDWTVMKDPTSASGMMGDTVNVYGCDIGVPGSLEWFSDCQDGLGERLGYLSFCEPLVNSFQMSPTNKTEYIRRWGDILADFGKRHYDLSYANGYSYIWGHPFWPGNRLNNLMTQLTRASTDLERLKQGISGAVLSAMLEEMPDILLDRLASGMHGAAPNQHIMCATGLIRGALAMEYFRKQSYWYDKAIEELEYYRDVHSRQDGTDSEQSLNYNGALIVSWNLINDIFVDNDLTIPQVITDLGSESILRIRMLLSLLKPMGNLPDMDCQDDRDMEDKLTEYVDMVGGDMLCSQIENHIWGDDSLAPPAFTSIQFPYGGYYVIRTGWGINDHHLFMKASRPARGHSSDEGNGIQVTAFGETLLIDSGSPYGSDKFPYIYQSWHTNTVCVDGYSQAMDRYPETAPTGVISARWHTSNNFDFIEGFYAEGYGPNWDVVIVSDVNHTREIVFIRDLGLYIIADRMITPASHSYTQTWNFPSSFAEGEVTTSGNEIVTQKAGGANNVAVYNFTTDMLSYQKYYGYQSGDDYRGWQGYDPAVDYHVGWSGSGDQLLVSLVRPMQASTSDGLTNVTDTSSGSLRGFSATVDSSTTVEYKAGITSGTITIGNISITGDSLLVVTETSGDKRGIVLGCSQMTINSTPQTVSTDFEFSIISSSFSSTDITTPDTFNWVKDGDNIYPNYH